MLLCSFSSVPDTNRVPGSLRWNLLKLHTHLDVKTLQHRHTERGRLSCSRLRPKHIREQLLKDIMDLSRTLQIITEQSHCLSSYWAMTSLPLMICLMALCWIAEGFSKPETWNKVSLMKRGLQKLSVLRYSDQYWLEVSKYFKSILIKTLFCNSVNTISALFTSSSWHTTTHTASLQTGRPAAEYFSCGLASAGQCCH